MPQINRNNNSFTVSIESETNRVVGGSESNFGGIREGTFIKLGEDSNLYSIAKINKIFYVKSFDVFDSKNIIINDDIGINLSREDCLKISYSEFELQTILSYKNSGRNYVIGDILITSGGDLSIDIQNGFGYPTKFEVTQVNPGNGAIENLSLKHGGIFIIPPKNPVTLIGGKGEDALIELKYSEIANKSILERVIKSINIHENKTRVLLDYSLPNSLKSGGLSCEKWELILQNNYIGETQKSINYQIYKDFSPNLGLTMLAKNSNSLEIIINNNSNKIDSAVYLLQQKIKELENKIKNL